MNYLSRKKIKFIKRGANDKIKILFLETTSLMSLIVVWGTRVKGMIGQGCSNLSQLRKTRLLGGLSLDRGAATLYNEKNWSMAHRQHCCTANSQLIKECFSRATKKQTLPAYSQLGLEYLWVCCASQRTETVVCSPEVFSVVANCLLPLSDSKNQPWYFFGWAERSSLAITSCLVNKLSSKTVSCQEPWSRGELTTPCSLDKTGLGLQPLKPAPLQNRNEKICISTQFQAETLLFLRKYATNILCYTDIPH